MASSLDLQEQEQLDALKAFWNRYGNLLTWVVTLALLGLAGFNGWNWWQREQAFKASALQAELERAALAGEMDRVGAAWNDLKSRYPATSQAQQAALVAAKAWVDKAQPDSAKAALEWAAEQAMDPAFRAVARLRLAGVLLDQDKAQEALAVLDKARGAGFDALVDDRRADALMVLGQPEQAKEALKAAYRALPDDLEYRSVLEARLMAAGVDPESVKPREKGSEKGSDRAADKAPKAGGAS